MDQKYIQLFDIYTHGGPGGMGRREFMDKLKMLAGTTAVSGILLQLENNYALAEVVPATDARLTAADTEIGPGLKGYLVYPKEA